MRLDHLNLLLSILGLAASVLLTTASLFVAGVAIGIVAGVLASPWVGRGCAWLAEHLGQPIPRRPQTSEADEQ